MNKTKGTITVAALILITITLAVITSGLLKAQKAVPTNGTVTHSDGIGVYTDLLSSMSVQADTTPVYFNGFETGSFGISGTPNQLGGTIAVSLTKAYTGLYSAKADITSGANKYAINNQNFGSAQTGLNASVDFYLDSGTPTVSDAGGFQIFGWGPTSGGCQANVILYNDGSAVRFGVRFYNGSWNDQINSTSTVSTGTWYHLVFEMTTVSARLWVDSLLTVSVSATLSNAQYCFIGAFYDNGNAHVEYFDNLLIMKGNIPLTRDTAFFCWKTDTNAHLYYISASDGYLWTTSSRNSNTLAKYNLTSGSYINSTNLAYLDHATDEAFSPYVYDGMVFVPAIGYQSSNTVLSIYNETTLEEIAHLVKASSDYTLMTVTYDPFHEKLLFGAEINNGTIGIVAVDKNQATNTSAYTLIPINNTGGGGMEATPIVFDGKVYVSYCGPDLSGTSHTLNNIVYVSTNLINWTVDYGPKNFTNTSPGAYFSHISATKNYIAYAYVSNETTNVSTQRIAYKNSTSAWVEIDTGVPEVSGEDHCNVVALNDNEMFLVETSARFNIYSPSLWLFNATSGSLARIITFDNMAYNDRTVGIDQTTNCIYVPNNEWDASTNTTAKIANISLGFPLFNMADYLNNYVIKFNITASHDAHSSIAPDDVTAVNKGADQFYSFSAITGYHIKDVIIDSIPQIITSNHTFTNVQTTHTIAVTSAINSYDITASSDGHSTITPNGATRVDYGNSQFYSYSASPGYSIQSVTVDGISVSITGNYTFSNVQTTHTIAVTSTINGNMSSDNLAISDIRV